ncbi:ankyrin repeat-containing domain protein [Nemania abortiva]|nr:ankyrin repeat-containing domain protein [Nemania abortiva]
MLRDSCLAALNLAFRADGIKPKFSSILETRISYPFLEYATEYILYHSNAAQATGILQHEFLQSFPLQRWLICDNIFRKRYTDTAQLLYVLAENNYAALLAIDPQRARHMEIQGELFGVPTLAAICQGHSEAVNTLLRDSGGLPAFDPSVIPDEYGPKLLSIAAKNGTVRGFAAILDLWPHGPIHIDYTDDSGRTPLFHAVRHGNIELVKYLLGREVKVNHQDNQGQTALHVAIKRLNVAVVQCLVDHGAKLELTDADSTKLLELVHGMGTDWSARKTKAIICLIDTGLITKLELTKVEASHWGISSLEKLWEEFVAAFPHGSGVKTTFKFVGGRDSRVLTVIRI